MSITPSWVTQFTDSISQAISDFNTVFVTNTASSSPSSSTIIAGVSGTGASNTYGRVLVSNDSQTELGILSSIYGTTSTVAAYIAGLQSLTGFYKQFYPVFNALDLTTGGLNTYLITNSLQVSAWFARAFNAWCSVAVQVTPGRTSSNAPTPIAAGNYFPTADVDSLWTFTCGAGTAMTTSQVGTNPTTTLSGGGVGQLVLYMASGSPAAGGATFTITYKNGSGSNTTATYTTTPGTPAASGSLASAYLITSAIGSQVVSVTGTGMTAGEQYVIGAKQIRTLSGY